MRKIAALPLLFAIAFTIPLRAQNSAPACDTSAADCALRIASDPEGDLAAAPLQGSASFAAATASSPTYDAAQSFDGAFATASSSGHAAAASTLVPASGDGGLVPAPPVRDTLLVSDPDETGPALRLGKDFTVQVHGTVRAKFEYQPDIDAGRFEVRNARFSLSGNVTPIVSYKAEIDLSDEGAIKMLDAYVRLNMLRSKLRFTIGQMRVPFTIDAHRSPHEQFFANRSFIAKQVGNVRDVGATLAYSFGGCVPVTLEGGIFNGSGLTAQKDFWTGTFNYSAKAQALFARKVNVTLSVQKTRPDMFNVMMYSAGAYYDYGRWHVEGEYLRKNYAGAFAGVNAVDGFACYDIPVKKVFTKISLLARYDYMSDHSNGIADADGMLKVNDPSRHRVTGGLTFSLGLPFTADVRLNYEAYFYRAGVTPALSERDKVVVEFMARF